MLPKSFEDGLHQNHWETCKTSGCLDLTPRELYGAGFWGWGWAQDLFLTNHQVIRMQSE